MFDFKFIEKANCDKGIKYHFVTKKGDPIDGCRSFY